MVDVTESSLPGIGRKHVMKIKAGGNVTVITKPDGKHELYHFKAKQDIPCDVLHLGAEESHQLAVLLGANFNRPAEVELVLGKLQIEWITLQTSSKSVGKSIGELRLRTLSGATIIAIMRGSDAISNPYVDERLQENDVVVLIGNDAQIKAANTLLD